MTASIHDLAGAYETAARAVQTYFPNPSPAPVWKAYEEARGALHSAVFPYAWQARISERIPTVDGPLLVAARIGGGDRRRVVLTGDGLESKAAAGGCRCGTRNDVRYEVWTPVGRVRHGYICGSCRYLTQSG